MTTTVKPVRSRPERTCVGCRKVASPDALLRVCLDGVRPDAASRQAVVDEAPRGRKRAGRGAWVHPASGCLHNAARGGLARSFRTAVDATPLITWALERGLGRISPLASAVQKS